MTFSQYVLKLTFPLVASFAFFKCFCCISFYFCVIKRLPCVVPSMQFKPEEITNIMKDFDEPGSLAPTGLFLGSTKYMVIQGEPGAVIRGKKVIDFLSSKCFQAFFSYIRCFLSLKFFSLIYIVLCFFHLSPVSTDLTLDI